MRASPAKDLPRSPGAHHAPPKALHPSEERYNARPMARELTIDDLMRKQQAMLELMLRLPNEKDADQITAISRQLEQDARDLEKLSKEFEQQELAKAGP